MKNSADTLNTLVQICHDGEDFYRKGASEIDNPQLKNLFSSMADLRTQAITDMEPLIEGRGHEVSESGTLAGTIRQGYAGLQKLLRDDEQVLIDQLEETEDRTLAAFKEAMEEKLPDTVHAVIADNYNKFRNSHAVMRQLKKQQH